MAGRDLHINYVQTGEGPDVVLVHGLGSRLEDWAPQIEALTAAGYRALAYDQRGHGRSGWVDEEIDINTFAHDLAHLMERLSIPKAHIVSLGAGVAQAFAHLYPEKVKSLVLAGSFSYFPEPLRTNTLKQRTDLIDAGEFPDMARTIAERSFTENAPRAMVEEFARNIAANNVKTYRASLVASVMSDSREYLSQITVPTLVMTGEGDITTPPELGRYIHENIKGSRFELIPGARHCSPLEQPALFNRIMLDFLNAVENK